MASSNEIPIKCYNHVVILIDCKLSMFISHPTPFRRALLSAFNYYDTTVIDNRLPQNFLSVLFLNDEPSKQVLIDFTMDPVQAYQEIFKLKQLSNAKIKSFYGKKNTGSFSKQLMNAMKRLKNKPGHLFFFTSEKDPTTSQQDKYDTMLFFKETTDWRDKFKIVSKPESHSAFCDLFRIPKECGITCDSIEKLSEKIQDSVYQERLGMRINMYPYIGSRIFMTCTVYGLEEHSEVSTTSYIHKETNEILHVKLSDEDVPSEEELRHSIRKDLPIGISLVEAKPANGGLCYDEIGSPCEPILVLGNSSVSEKNFASFWSTMKEMLILCYVKFKPYGYIHTVELTPLKMKGELFFEMRFIPSILEWRLPIDYQPYKGKVPISKPGKERDREHILDMIIGKMTIHKVSEFTNSVPPDDWKEREYAKKQLLGSDYKMVKEPNPWAIPCPGDKDLDKLLASLERYSAREISNLNGPHEVNCLLEELEPLILSDGESSGDDEEELVALPLCDLFPRGPKKRRPLMELEYTPMG